MHSSNSGILFVFSSIPPAHKTRFNLSWETLVQRYLFSSSFSITPCILLISNLSYHFIFHFISNFFLIFFLNIFVKVVEEDRAHIKKAALHLGITSIYLRPITSSVFSPPHLRKSSGIKRRRRRSRRRRRRSRRRRREEEE